MEKFACLDEKYYEELLKSLVNEPIPVPRYDEYRWTKENLQNYLNSIKSAQNCSTERYPSCKMFFIAEHGNLLQNNHLIDCVVWYKRTGCLSDDNLEKIMSYENPILRVEAMVEISPGSGMFEERVFDLIALATEREDWALINRLSLI